MEPVEGYAGKGVSVGGGGQRWFSSRDHKSVSWTKAETWPDLETLKVSFCQEETRLEVWEGGIVSQRELPGPTQLRKIRIWVWTAKMFCPEASRAIESKWKEHCPQDQAEVKSHHEDWRSFSPTDAMRSPKLSFLTSFQTYNNLEWEAGREEEIEKLSIFMKEGLNVTQTDQWPFNYQPGLGWRLDCTQIIVLPRNLWVHTRERRLSKL